jgi:hypothetical protein
LELFYVLNINSWLSALFTNTVLISNWLKIDWSINTFNSHAVGTNLSGVTDGRAVIFFKWGSWANVCDLVIKRFIVLFVSSQFTVQLDAIVGLNEVSLAVELFPSCGKFFFLLFSFFFSFLCSCCLFFD